MFAVFDHDEFPIVRVTLNNIENREDFENFLNEWLRLYEQKKPFTFIFDTTTLEVYNIKYKFLIKMYIIIIFIPHC